MVLAVVSGGAGGGVLVTLGDPAAPATSVCYVGDPAGEPLYVTGRGYAWQVSMYGGVTPLVLPGHSLAASSGAAVSLTASGMPCDRCVYLPGLSQGRTYYVRVRTVTQRGASAYTSAVGGVPRTVPAAPRGVVAVPVSDHEVAVSWTCPADDGYGDAACGRLASFTLEVDLAALFDTAARAATVIPLTPAAGTAFSYLLTATGAGLLTNGTAVYVRVWANNVVPADSNAAWVPPQVLADNVARTLAAPFPVTAAYQPPAAPTSVVATPLAATALRVTFIAPASDGGRNITSYEVAVATAAGAAVNTVSVPAASAGLLTPASGSTPATLLLDVPGVRRGVAQCLRVCALNAVGGGGWSATPACAVPRGKAAAPGAVRVAAAPGGDASDNRTLTVAWLPSAYSDGSVAGSDVVTGYRVEVWSDDALPARQRLAVYNSQGRGDTVCTGPGAGSTFCAMQLSLHGALSLEFPLDESAADLRHHLLALTDADGVALLGYVAVARTTTYFGYESRRRRAAWRVWRWRACWRAALPTAAPAAAAPPTHRASMSRWTTLQTAHAAAARQRCSW